MAVSAKELRRRGVSDENIRIARIVQDAQRRTGSPVHTLAQIIDGHPPAATAPGCLTKRQLRKRGRYGTAAILADQEALQESDAQRALKARHASAILKELAQKPVQLEFDFFRGNWSVADAYHDTIRDRIHALPLSPAKRAMAIMVMAEIVRWLPWEDAACSKTAAEMADLLKVCQMDISTALKTLEQVGAIRRVVRGRTKLIYVNPEGAYRGNVNNHADAVDRYSKTIAKAGGAKPGTKPGTVVPLRPVQLDLEDAINAAPPRR
jgi:hypothetical protein